MKRRNKNELRTEMLRLQVCQVVMIETGYSFAHVAHAYTEVTDEPAYFEPFQGKPMSRITDAIVRDVISILPPAKRTLAHL